MATFNKYKKKGKNYYMFKAYLGTDSSGKRIDTTRRGFTTMKEAKNALRQLQIDFTADSWEAKTNVVTFDDLFHEWFNSYKLSVRKSTSSGRYVIYERLYKNTIGPKRLSSITPAYLQKLVNDLSLKYSYLPTYISMLRMPFRYAYRLGIIQENPFDRVLLPKGRKSPHEKEINFYNKDQLNYFLDCAKKMTDPRVYYFFRLIAFTGVRKGEAFALTWSDIDFTKNEIRINKTVSNDPLNNRVYVQEPKTKESKRTVSVDLYTMDQLSKWHIDQQKYFFKKGIRINEDKQFLFAAQTDNRINNPTMANRWLQRIYQRFPQKQITVHGFRHTHASLLFEAGASLKEVQTRLGHANSKFTLDVYTHVMKSRTSETGQKFADYMQN